MIVDAARKTMAKRGLQDLRLDEVAVKARVAKGTLYLYFKDKIDLLAGVYLDLAGELDLRIGAIDETLPALDRLKAVMDAHLGFIDEHESFILGFMGGHPDLERGKAGRMVKERWARLIERYGKVFAACIRAGGLRRVDPLIAGMYLFKTVEVFLERKKLVRDGIPLSRRRREIMRLLLEGLGKGG